jgi:hypothetical protein
MITRSLEKAKKFLKELEVVIQNRNKVDQEILKEQNITLGWRDDLGAGIVVGATTKGCVIGYTKKFLAVIKGEKPESGTNPIIVDPEEIYEKLYGYKPNPDQLKSLFLN